MANLLKSTEGSRLINAQPKAQKLFGVSKTNINSHFKATAKAQYKANYKPIRGKVAAGAAAVLAVITIGKLQLFFAHFSSQCNNFGDGPQFCYRIYCTVHNTTQHNTTQHNTTQHNTTQHNTTQHNTTVTKTIKV
jgi:hypothetical protein